MEKFNTTQQSSQGQQQIQSGEKMTTANLIWFIAITIHIYLLAYRIVTLLFVR